MGNNTLNRIGREISRRDAEPLRKSVKTLRLCASAGDIRFQDVIAPYNFV